MRVQWFKITGSDEGIEIEPYYVNDRDNDLDYHLETTGDSVRYYAEISSYDLINVLSEQIVNQQVNGAE